jgi:hypothetical protein
MHGDFSASESLGLITKMIHLEIKFYEDKIQKEKNSAKFYKDKPELKDQFSFTKVKNKLNLTKKPNP